MNGIGKDYLSRTYAGWISKLVGIRLGAQIEGWTYHRIEKELGEITGYTEDMTRFAADDDSNGPMIFIRALNDYTCSRDLTARQIGLGWLNYAPYEHGFYWWGGYGKSTEHTAYLNLCAGIDAPRSGSIAQNGVTVAEQIGGQIFIDTWGLVCPGQPELAAEFGAKAASVSHDGNGVYGGMFVAAAIAAAYVEKNVRSVIERALECIPQDCLYVQVVRDVMRFYDAQSQKNWREAFLYIESHYGYDKFPGACHIIPNAAVMILGMLYGGDDYDSTLLITNMCGWDTDCNVGNVATIMGVLLGIEAIDYDKWLKPVADTFSVSSTLGCLNRMDALQCAMYLCDIGYRLAGEKVPENISRNLQPGVRSFPFMFSQNTHGFYAHGGEMERGVVDGSGLTFRFKEGGCIARRTYMHPDDFMDNRYDPAFAPEIYGGQSARYVVFADRPVKVTPYARERFSGEKVYGESVTVGAAHCEIVHTLPAGLDTFCDEAGLLVESGACVTMMRAEYAGVPDYRIDFSRMPMEEYTTLHREVPQFTYHKGNWDILDGRLSGSAPDKGEIYSGDLSFENYHLEATVTRVTAGSAGLLIGVRGALSGYAAVLDGDTLSLIRNDCGYRELSKCAFSAPLGTPVRLGIRAVGTGIEVYQGERVLLSWQAGDPVQGCFGFGVYGGCRALFDDAEVRGGTRFS